MTSRSARPNLGAWIFFSLTLGLTAYFTFAAVRGDFGLFRRAEIAVEAERLEREVETLRAEVARMENMTMRLSDEFLDLDLLDQQARDVLGFIRADEVVVN
jgi:cell division protein FtsB